MGPTPQPSSPCYRSTLSSLFLRISSLCVAKQEVYVLFPLPKRPATVFICIYKKELPIIAKGEVGGSNVTTAK